MFEMMQPSHRLNRDRLYLLPLVLRQGLTRASAALMLICALPLSAGEESYLGAEVCGSCHPEQFALQSASGHFASLHRAAEHPLAENFPNDSPFERAPKFRYKFVLTKTDLRVQAHDSEYFMDLPIQWTFGAGVHGVGFVSQINDGMYLEHSLTYYTTTKSLGLTPGHENIEPNTLHEAMGLRYQIEETELAISRCFRCHTTGPVSFSPEYEVQITEPGVRCEVCHGPGSAHLEAVSRGALHEARKLIQNPNRLSAPELNEFCGTCHRFPGQAAAHIDWSEPWNIRHQPPYLRESACFQKSSGALTCLTCHDPHEPLRRNDPAHYRQKCTSCHTASALPPKEICGAQRSPDCTSCHMPSLALNPHLNFRNHWIGVYLEGKNLMPSR